MNMLICAQWDGTERRERGRCRRKARERRSHRERRSDRRQGRGQKRSPLQWLRSVCRARLGVDRRQRIDQRGWERRTLSTRSLLTKEELNELLA